MKRFKMSPFLCMSSVSLVYLIAGMVDLFVYKFVVDVAFLQMAYVVILALPLAFRPLGCWVGYK